MIKYIILVSISIPFISLMITGGQEAAEDLKEIKETQNSRLEQLEDMM